MWLPGRRRSLMISSTIWIQYTNVRTDKRADTGRQQRPCKCIASRGKNNVNFCTHTIILGYGIIPKRIRWTHSAELRVWHSTKPNQTTSTYSLAKKILLDARGHVPTCPLAGDATGHLLLFSSFLGAIHNCMLLNLDCCAVLLSGKHGNRSNRNIIAINGENLTVISNQQCRWTDAGT